MQNLIEKKLKYAGIFRRLFAIFYDIFLLTAILFIVSAIATALNHGAAIDSNNTIYPLFVLIIFLLCYLYFAWFWIHGGQSLGMKTWQIKLQNCDGNPIGWKTSVIRYLAATLSWAVVGLGFLWALFDKKNRCWHDFVCNTVIIDLRTKK